MVAELFATRERRSVLGTYSIDGWGTRRSVVSPGTGCAAAAPVFDVPLRAP